jgi:transformation/transcription domain-associated protein
LSIYSLIRFKRALHDNTKLAIMFEQQGLFYQAQKLYEEVISRAVDVYLSESGSSNHDELLEFNLWEERWIVCCKELNQWSELSEYAATKENDISLSLECAWKSQQKNDWSQMKSLLLSQKDINLPKDQSWRWPLYQGYYIVCNPEDYHHLMLASNQSNPNSNTNNNNQTLQAVFSSSTAIESKIERCMLLALKEWRRLPRLVSPIHMTLLQAAQQIVELQEAFQIQNNLLMLAYSSSSNSTTQGSGGINTNTNPASYLQEIKGIIKTWRTRLPLINDDLSYWNDIFTWRQYHYESFTSFYEKQQQIGAVGGANPAMLGVHALAQGIVHFGKIARKQHLYDLCLETLNKIHKKQSVPIVDCFLKVKQEIKCYINTFEYLNVKQSQELLDVIEATNLRYFTKENVAELISLKAQFLLLCGKYDDANHLYSFSIYLNDSQARLWGAWGDYLTQAYVDACARLQNESNSSFAMRSIETAESSLIALLHAARHSNSECKTRKYISKILWLLTYDNEKRQLYSTFDAYACTIQASHWINWIPQLITLLMRNDDTGKYLINIMNQIVKMYPLALYYPLRTVYLKLKNDENAEKLKSQLILQQQQKQQQQQQQDIDMKDSNLTATPSTPKSASFNQQTNSTATESLIRVTTLMHRQREMHPTLFNTLEGLIDQLLNLKVNWYEELLRNFKQTLIHAYMHAYEFMKSQNLSSPLKECLIDPLSILWFKKLHKFYLDSYWDKFRSLQNSATGGQNLNNQLANHQNTRLRGILAIVNDPNYKITLEKFIADFQTPPNQFVNTFTFIGKLKNWIALFELHLRSLPRQQLLDDRFKFVTQFCSTTAEIEIPGEFLIPRSTNYCVRISRFLPRYESIEKLGSYMRRISIRGHNGKIYPFLIANEGNPDKTYYDGRKEEHVMQLMRMLNSYLSKQKETASRNLFFTLPRVVSLSVDVRMIEDDCSAISLLDIYKNRNKKLSSMMAQQQKQNLNKSMQTFFVEITLKQRRRLND